MPTEVELLKIAEDNFNESIQQGEYGNDALEQTHLLRSIAASVLVIAREAEGMM